VLFPDSAQVNGDGENPMIKKFAAPTNEVSQILHPKKALNID